MLQGCHGLHDRGPSPRASFRGPGASPRREALSPDLIASDLGLPLEQAVLILSDLEKHMTFLFRNRQGEVTWAYPVTVERTPHHLTFSTGEQEYAA